ncbi:MULTISPECIES: hypothetical protein [Neisseria]|nr:MULTISPECIES: hypothetical protein [Neisseria]
MWLAKHPTALIHRMERRDKERGRLKRRCIAIAAVGKYDEYPAYG